MDSPIQGRIQHNSFSERKKFDWLWLSVVFLLALNFFNSSSVLLLALVLVGLFCVYYKNARFRITSDLLLIGFFSISYFVVFFLHTDTGIGSMLTFLIGPVACFSVGYFVVKSEHGFIVKTMLAVALGNFTHGLLNMLNFYQLHGIFSMSIERRVPDIWTGIHMAATLQGTYFVLSASLLFYGMLLFSRGKAKLLPIILVLLAIFAFFTSVTIGNRTLPIVFIIILTSNTLLFSRLANGKDYAKVLTLIIALCGAIVLVYTSGMFGLQDYVQQSVLYDRLMTMSLAEDPRMEVYGRVLSQMFNYPFGGRRMDLGLNFAHNLWLDILFVAGIIPFLFIILFTIKVIYNIVVIVQSKCVDLEIRVFALSIFLGYFLVFMVEPILEGVPYMFLTFCLFSGMICKIANTTSPYATCPPVDTLF